jgi:hypothetical protein
VPVGQNEKIAFEPKCLDSIRERIDSVNRYQYTYLPRAFPRRSWQGDPERMKIAIPSIGMHDHGQGITAATNKWFVNLGVVHFGDRNPVLSLGRARDGMRREQRK